MFPPPVVDISEPVGNPCEPVDLGTLCPDPPLSSPRSPHAKWVSRAILAGAMAGICLGVFMKVGVFAHARPQYPRVSAQALPGASKISWGALTDIPAPPQVNDLGTIPVQVIVQTPATPSAVPSPTGFGCHREILADGSGVRVCRPNSVAATPIPKRTLR